MTDIGTPDYILTHRGVPLGYVEAKDVVGVDLHKTGRTDQLKRYSGQLALVLISF